MMRKKSKYKGVVWILVGILAGIGSVLIFRPVAAMACTPAISYTTIPPYNSFQDLSGQTGCVTPADYNVVVYLRVGGGWWVKPNFAQPLTPIQAEGQWSTDITTGGLDPQATNIVAFLIPDGYNPPLLAGDSTLPAQLYTQAVAYTQVVRTPRTVNFSNQIWYVKQSDSQIGPGPNHFSDDPQDVWVDSQGRLHLKISHRDGKWYSTEVYTQKPLGYGEYYFRLASPVNNLDPNVVLGLFTWDDAAPPDTHYREIDIEYAKFGNGANPNNAQFTVQPYTVVTNTHPFSLTYSGSESTHWFSWQAGQIDFANYRGYGPSFNPADLLEAWSYSGTDIPPNGPANARINLWLFGGNAPTNGQEVEIIIGRFEFVKSRQYLPLILVP